MVTKYCKKCGAALEASYKFCLMCGAPVPKEEPAAPSPASFFGHSAAGVGSAPAKALCKKCGSPLEPGYKFCMVCGAPAGTATTSSQPSIPVAKNPVPPAPAPAPSYTPRSYEVEDEPTIVVEEDFSPKGLYDDEATTVLAAEMRVTLERLRTGEVLELHVPCVVGKGSAADCKISGNSAISRKHIRVYSDDTIGGNLHVYVEDLGSLNKTKVESETLHEGTSRLVEDGAHITLADEKFILHIQAMS